MLVTQQLLVPIDFHSMWGLLWKQMATTTGLLTHIQQNIFFCVIPSRSLRSASERRLVVPSQRLKITLQNILVHRSWPVEWSSHCYPECWIPVNLQATTENSCLSTLLDFIIKNKQKIKNIYSFPYSISSSFSFSFSPSLARLYLFEQCLRLGVTSASSVCLPLQD